MAKSEHLSHMANDSIALCPQILSHQADVPCQSFMQCNTHGITELTMTDHDLSPMTDEDSWLYAMTVYICAKYITNNNTA